MSTQADLKQLAARGRMVGGAVMQELPFEPEPKLLPPLPDPFTLHGAETLGGKMWLEGGVVEQGMLTLLTAPSKAGKSWALYELALLLACGAEGREWLGVKVTGEARVLLVDLEIEKRAIPRRLGALKERILPGHILGENLQILSLRTSVLRRSPEDIFAHIQAKAVGAQVIIIDSIYLLLQGDESDPMAAQALFKLILNLRDAGFSVVLSHHMTKGNAETQLAKEAIDRGSGSGWWARFPDVLLSLTPLPPDGGEREALIEATVRHHASPGALVVRWDAPSLLWVKTGKDVGLLRKQKAEKDLSLDARSFKAAVRRLGGGFPCFVEPKKVFIELKAEFTATQARAVMNYSVEQGEILMNEFGDICLPSAEKA